MYKYRVIFLLLCFVLATYSFAQEFTQNQCANTNWYQLGLSDGINGYPSTNIKIAEKECSTYGVVVDVNAYIAGWQRGIQQYYNYYNNIPSTNIYVNPPYYNNTYPRYYIPYFSYGYPHQHESHNLFPKAHSDKNHH